MNPVSIIHPSKWNITLSGIYLGVDEAVEKYQVNNAIVVRTIPSLADIVNSIAENNTIFAMMTNFGYINMFVNTVKVSKLNNYPNFIVFCLDRESYDVYN
jgi:hypothetical protein